MPCARDLIEKVRIGTVEYPPAVVLEARDCLIEEFHAARKVLRDALEDKYGWQYAAQRWLDRYQFGD